MLRLYAATFGANAAIFAVGLVSSIVLLRILGPTVVGQYALVVATYTTLVNLATLGVNVSTSTFAASDRSSVHALATHALLLSFGVGLLPLAAYLAARPWLDATVFAHTPPGLVVIGLLIVPCSLFATHWGALMVGLHEIGLLNRLNLANTVLTSLGQVLFVWLVRQDAYGVLGSSLVGALAFNLVMVVLLLRRHRWRPRLDPALLRRTLSFGARSHAGNIAHYLFLRLDYYVVSSYAGPTALGHYSLATSLAEKLWLAVQPLYSVAFARIAGDNPAASREMSRRLGRAVLWLLALLSLGLALGATLLVAPIYTERFLPALAPLYRLLPGVAAFGASWFLGLHIISHLRRPELTTALAWAGLALSVPLYLVLTARYGIEGAAAASSLTYVFVFAGTAMIYARVTGAPVTSVLVPQAEDWRFLRAQIARLRLRLGASPGALT